MHFNGRVRNCSNAVRKPIVAIDSSMNEVMRNWYSGNVTSDNTSFYTKYFYSDFYNFDGIKC